MKAFLDLYNSHQVILNLIKDIFYLAGFTYVIKNIWDFQYINKTKEIGSNLEKYEKMRPLLDAHVKNESDNGIRDICVRLIYWKNYLLDLHDDGYAQSLHIRYHGENPLYGSWIDSSGLFLLQRNILHAQSLYLEQGRKKIFFFDKSGSKHKNFNEIGCKGLVMHLPFKNIVNYDFQELNEYEPVLYTRYKYSDENLYSNRCRAVLSADENTWLDLDKRYMMSSWSVIMYTVMHIKLCAFKAFERLKLFKS